MSRGFVQKGTIFLEEEDLVQGCGEHAHDDKVHDPFSFNPERLSLDPQDPEQYRNNYRVSEYCNRHWRQVCRQKPANWPRQSPEEHGEQKLRINDPVPTLDSNRRRLGLQSLQIGFALLAQNHAGRVSGRDK